MGALDGLKIADFSWVGAGPRSTKDLADNGANVVKVESAKRLDLGRRSPPFVGGDKDNYDASVFFAQTNTSKKSVTINLSDPRGVEVAKKLIAWADVVVENFGPGYMDRIGLSWNELQLINPDIILASVSVAGRTGPLGGFRGYGNSAAAYSGHCDLTGWPNSEPHMPPFAYGDVVAPMMLTVAILSALEQRDNTKKGCHVDVSQIESMVHVAGDLFAELPNEKPANSDYTMAPHGVYTCKSDNTIEGEAWIAIACETDNDWQALCNVLGAGELFERWPNSAGSNGRIASRDALDAALEALTLKEDLGDLEKRLVAAGVPAAAVLDGKGLAQHPALNAVGHFVSVDHPVIGPMKMPAPPYSFSETPTHIGPSPCLGTDNKLVFGEIGIDDEQIASLTSEGVLI